MCVSLLLPSLSPLPPAADENSLAIVLFSDDGQDLKKLNQESRRRCASSSDQPTHPRLPSFVGKKQSTALPTSLETNLQARRPEVGSCCLCRLRWPLGVRAFDLRRILCIVLGTEPLYLSSFFLDERTQLQSLSCATERRTTSSKLGARIQRPP